MERLFITAGEQSGDKHGAELISALKKNFPRLVCQGITGNALRAEGVETISRVEDLSVMGFSDVLWSLPRLVRIFYRIRNAILAASPQLVLMVDSPSFNLRLGKSLRKKGYQGKLIQYISPSVWAWGRQRTQVMAKFLDMLLTIYPFEKDYFSDTNLQVEYVGNPLVTQIKNAKLSPDWRRQAGIPLDVPLISLFPGSRKSEVSRNLPLMLSAAKKLAISGSHFAISIANPSTFPLVHDIAKNFSFPHTLIDAEKTHYELMMNSQVALAKSGTVTLELALCGCPTVVIYPLTSLNRWVADKILHVSLPYYCIVNILAKEEVYPEFIVTPPTETNVSQALESILFDQTTRSRILEGCQKVRYLLSDNNAAETSAMLLAKVLG